MDEAKSVTKPTDKTRPEKVNEVKPENQNTRLRRAPNYRHKVNQQGRPDYYQKNQRYDTRFAQRNYHYLSTGPIN